MPNQGDHVGRRGVTEVDQNVRVDERDLRVPDAMALEAALIDKTTGADPFDLLEDRPGAGMPIEPGMPCATPAEVLLHDAMHHVRILPLELKGRRQDHVSTMMEDRVVIPESHVRRVDGQARALLGEEVGGPEHFGDEHRALALRSGRQEMQVLPDRTADRAGDADVMLEPGPPTPYRFGDDLGHHGATLDPEQSVLAKGEVGGDVSDHEPAHALVRDEDVRPKPEDEVRNLRLARG